MLKAVVYIFNLFIFISRYFKEIAFTLTTLKTRWTLVVYIWKEEQFFFDGQDFFLYVVTPF